MKVGHWDYFSHALSDFMKPNKSDEFDAEDAHKQASAIWCFQKVRIRMPISERIKVVRLVARLLTSWT